MVSNEYFYINLPFQEKIASQKQTATFMYVAVIYELHYNKYRIYYSVVIIEYHSTTSLGNA